MPDRKLKIISTSFIPAGSILNPLKKTYSSIELAEIGEWSALNNTDSDVLCLISFSDIVQFSNFLDGIKRIQAITTQVSDSARAAVQNFFVFCVNDLTIAPVTIANQSNGYWRFINAVSERISNLTMFPNIFAVDMTPFATNSDVKFFCARNHYSVSCRWSLAALKAIFQQATELANAVYEPVKKVLVVDCDNTIWGGVIGEDGINNIKLGTDGEGRIYSSIQALIRHYQQKGILIAICSKNSERDVLSVFEQHPQMLLKKSDIVSFKVNWNEKSQNIKELSDELGLALNSFIFLDDNPLEREKVRSFLPDVDVIDLDAPLHEWPVIIQNTPQINRLNDTLEDVQKTLQYQARAVFNRQLESETDINSYLKSLDIKVELRDLTAIDAVRASQLCLKTNQFNFTLERLTEPEIRDRLEDDRFWMKMVRVRDNFGDHGDVALLIVQREEGYHELRIFNMSCRVLGRKVEFFLLNVLHDNFGRELVIKYQRGPRNEMLENILNFGFEKRNSDGRYENDEMVTYHIFHNFTLPPEIKEIFDETGD